MNSQLQRSNRREFLTVGCVGLAGLHLADALASERTAGTSSPPANAAILIWLGGGPATIDMWDPKPDAPENIRGEFAAIRTDVPGIEIGEHLPRMAKVMSHCALVRSLSHSISAHGPGAEYVMTGNRPSAAVDHPSLGSIASAQLPPRSGMPPYITFGTPPGREAGLLGAAHNPFEVSGGSAKLDGVSLPASLPNARFEKWNRLRDQIDRRFDSRSGDAVSDGLRKFQEQALDLLRSDRIAKAFRVEEEPETIRKQYGNSPLGRNTLAARRLVEAGARFVTIGTTGWDTHNNNFQTLENRLLPRLDDALSSLIGDLHARGLLETTLVCCIGEFGRTPQINGSGGRDHWPRSMAALLAGGGLKRGIAYGRTDKHGLQPEASPCSPDDIAATLLHQLTGRERLLITSVNNRTQPAFRNGQCLTGLCRTSRT